MSITTSEYDEIVMGSDEALMIYMSQEQYTYYFPRIGIQMTQPSYRIPVSLHDQIKKIWRDGVEVKIPSDIDDLVNEHWPEIKPRNLHITQVDSFTYMIPVNLHWELLRLVKIKEMEEQRAFKIY